MTLPGTRSEMQLLQLSKTMWSTCDLWPHSVLDASGSAFSMYLTVVLHTHKACHLDIAQTILFLLICSAYSCNSHSSCLSQEYSSMQAVYRCNILMASSTDVKPVWATPPPPLSTPRSSHPIVFKLRSYISCAKVRMLIDFGCSVLPFVATRRPKVFFLCALKRPEFSTDFLHSHTNYALDQGSDTNRLLAPCGSTSVHKKGNFIFKFTPYIL